jgi:predicted cupin superfamily sugar epimerase
MKSAEYWIERLELQKHPEGGWFREIYRSADVIGRSGLPGSFTGDRNCSTSIYYLLDGNNFSAFHRIKSDEIWHYYDGSSAVEIWIATDGKVSKHLLGKNFEEGEKFQVVVPKNQWFAARLKNQKGYALAGCTVSPGFHFEDFEMADKKQLLDFYVLGNEIGNLLR